MSVCAEPGCWKLAGRGSRCPDHLLPGPVGYGSKHWDRVRLQRLAFDDRVCQLRHPGCTVVATTVHLAPELGGNHLLATLENTVSACLHCHGVEDGPRAGFRDVPPDPSPDDSLPQPERILLA